MKKYIVIIIIFILLAFLSRSFFAPEGAHRWQFRSIDTMKYSRDLSREKLHNASFDKEIEKQISAIAKTGATHVAIATPYDEEFIPIMRRWVLMARKYHLKVWFRGNMSGWEEWFGYPQVDRSTHTAQTEQFILNNKDLFQDGDIFTSCPECENGPKVNWGDEKEVEAYRAFLITEYGVTKKAFGKIHKNVKANYYSMNGDVARIVMDRETTRALDGVVTIDHYVSSPEQLAADIKILAERSGGKVVLGEFGAPIPDINGPMSPKEQSAWLEKALGELSKVDQLEGVNYWVNKGGSTALWDENGKARPGVKVLTEAFN